MNRKNVLVADDDELVRQRLDRFFTARGFQVECAESGEPVIARLKDPPRPSLLILDLRMPLTSGLQFLRAIRAIPGLTNTPVAIVTGDYYLDDAQSNEIKELGAELRYKPLWLEELVTLARELLNIPVRD